MIVPRSVTVEVDSVTVEAVLGGSVAVVVGAVEEVVAVVVGELVVEVGVLVALEVLMVDEEVVAVPPSSEETTARAIARPSTAATRTPIAIFSPLLMPDLGGSSPRRGGGTSMRRVGSSCIGARV